MVAVIEEIHAQIHILVLHLGVIRDVGPPLLRIVAKKVVGLARQLIDPDNLRCRVRADEFHAQDRRRWGLGTESWWVLNWEPFRPS